MFKNNYNKVLTVLLIIIVIAILVLLGIGIWNLYKKYSVEKSASDFVDDYQGDISFGDEDSSNNIGNNVELDIGNNSVGGNNTSEPTKTKYQGFTVQGTIKIPAINLKYPLLTEVTKKSIETAVAILYPNPDNLNKSGNTVIIGHNYRNGQFFSNVKKLVNGDKIYIRDYTGKELTYNIYNKFLADSSDTSFYQRDTNGVPEVTLSTCTDASDNQRIIVFARAE